MKIILKKEVANLGEAGELVNVKTGYALNYLIPQGFAIAGTPSAIKQHEETLRQRAHKEAKLVADAQAAAAKLEATPVSLTAKVSESGKFYGAITSAMVAEALGIDKKDITLPEIKEVGEYEAKVKCYKGVFATVKVTVAAE